jgi:c-di-GMP-related signal transduction protein
VRKLRSILSRPRDPASQYPLTQRDESSYRGIQSAMATDSHRYFALQPIVSLSRRAIGCEALFRTELAEPFQANPSAATRTMIDNWLLYGFEDLTDGHLTFLNCTRETLLSGLLTLLPKWAVFEILETVEPDEEVLKACRKLKKQGYLISLDDFESPEKMAGFLELADFIKIDFRISEYKERIRLMRSLKGTRAILIAEKIETEEEFRLAKWEGFQLFQGYYFRDQASFAMPKDFLRETNCLRILETLDEIGFAINKLTELINLEPGIGCRLLRRANWITAEGSPVNTYRDALKLIGKNEFRQLVSLAMLAEVEDWGSLPAELLQYCDIPSLAWSDKYEPAPNYAERRLHSMHTEIHPPVRGNILQMPAPTEGIKDRRRKMQGLFQPK